MVDPSETLGGDNMAMIHGPSSDHRVQGQDQVINPAI
jgi:hypothetical protein